MVGYDANPFLCDFWQSPPEETYKAIKNIDTVSKEQFKQMQKDIQAETDPFKRAGMFFVLNRCSFSGTTTKGGMSKGHPRYNAAAKERLKKFKTYIKVENKDFTKSIPEHRNTHKLFLDPPYLIEQDLYEGHKGFDHIRLAQELKDAEDILLCYNDHPWIRETYKDRTIQPLEWSYGMNASKISNEVAIY